MDRASVLIDTARRQTGLEYFGEDSFREGLGKLTIALDSEARLNDLGRTATDGQIVHFLSCRLQIEDWYSRHPEIDEQEIVAPVIGLGLPRTGSTAFGCLLGEDPNARVIRMWETMQPCPPPEKATEHIDPRINSTAAVLAQQDQLYPRMKLMLPISATMASECQSFMGYDFKSQTFMALAHIPSYVHWLQNEADLVPTYRYVKRVLKLLQWRCPPNRWRLKNPSHSLFIDAVNEVFPDARFWMTHRDVTKVIPSVCELYLEMSGPLTETVDKAAIALQNIEFTELGQRRVIAFRDEGGQDSRFFDVQFEAVQADPVREVANLYDWLGETLSAEAHAHMETWWRESRRERPAGYRATDFGLDLAALRERFRFYNERFHVQIKDDQTVPAQ